MAKKATPSIVPDGYLAEALIHGTGFTGYDTFNSKGIKLFGKINNEEFSEIVSLSEIIEELDFLIFMGAY